MQVCSNRSENASEIRKKSKTQGQLVRRQPAQLVLDQGLLLRGRMWVAGLLGVQQAAGFTHAGSV